jgi:hypothetical protein
VRSRPNAIGALHEIGGVAAAASWSCSERVRSTAVAWNPLG